jgi:hypothetical protein
MSISRSFTSSSKRRPDSLRRSRVLKRGCRYERLEDHHFPYLWVAYKTGVFSHLAEFKDEMDSDTFRKTMLAVLGNVLNSGDAWMLYGKASKHPVGMMVGLGAENRMEPHVFWFSNSTPRNRLECVLKWLIDAKQKYALFLWIKEPDWRLYFHLCKYGVIREVGKYRNFPGGGDAMLFQGVN